MLKLQTELGALLPEPKTFLSSNLQILQSPSSTLDYIQRLLNVLDAGD